MDTPFDDINEFHCSFEYCIKNGQYSTVMDVVYIVAYQDVHLALGPLHVCYCHLRSSEGQNLTGHLAPSENMVSKPLTAYQNVPPLSYISYVSHRHLPSGASKDNDKCGSTGGLPSHSDQRN